MSRRKAVRALLSWSAAGAIIFWLARGIPFGALADSLRQARLSLFLAVMVASFLGWFFGETLLFSRLFTYLHEPVSWLEMLPMTATLYLTQVVNGVLAGGIFTILMHRRRGIHWLESGFTMLLLGLLDFQIMALTALIAAFLDWRSPLHHVWRFAAVALAVSTAVAAFWLRGRPSLPAAAKLYDWQPMSGFRRARPVHYLKLATIRTPIFLLQGVTFYFCLRSFSVHVPIGYVLTLTPAILLVTALPITPIGIGAEQAAIVLGFQAYAPRSTLLAMSLAISVLSLLLRLALAPFAALSLTGAPGRPKKIIRPDSMKRVKILGYFLVLLAARPALAQEYGAGFARFLGYNEDRARYFSAEQVGDRGPFLWRQELEASQTVIRSTDSAWVVSGRAGELQLGSPSVVIPQTGVVVPRKLWSAQGGLGYRRDLGERRRWGASASFGSASDRLFLAWREDQASASAYYQLPSRAHNSWIFLLNYSNNRPFANNVPLPGVAYMIEDPVHRLDALIGFPFLSVRWRPDDDWTLSAGLFGPAAYSLETARRLTQRASAYARLEKAPFQWLRAGRLNDTDRLVFDSKQTVLGVRCGLWPGASLDLSAGRVFDRRFFEARDANRSGSAPRAALANATVIQAAFAWRWDRS